MKIDNYIQLITWNYLIKSNLIMIKIRLARTLKTRSDYGFNLLKMVYSGFQKESNKGQSKTYAKKTGFLLCSVSSGKHHNDNHRHFIS